MPGNEDGDDDAILMLPSLPLSPPYIDTTRYSHTCAHIHTTLQDKTNGMPKNKRTNQRREETKACNQSINQSTVVFLSFMF